MQRFRICPILPAGLLAVQDGNLSPIEQGMHATLTFAKAHGLKVGLIGDRIRLHLPAELFGFYAETKEQAIERAYRVCFTYRFAVAVLAVDGEEATGVLRVNP
jgi:hypothetical protein